MNAHLVTIVDAQHWADNWTGAAPFEIEAETTNVAGWPNAPVSVHLMDGVSPQRAAYLLQEIANALLRNGSAWLPRFDDELSTQPEALSPEDEKKLQHGYRQIEALHTQIEAIRATLPFESIPF